jgi:hypothetical protein
VFGLTFGVVVAAEVIKIELKDFSMKSKAGEESELVGYNAGEEKLFFYTFGTGTATVKIPDDGEYTITIEASCDEAKGEKAKLSLKVGDTEVAKSFELKEVGIQVYPFTAKLKKGESKLAISFLNDIYKESEYDSNLYIHAVKLEPKKK